MSNLSICQILVICLHVTVLSVTINRFDLTIEAPTLTHCLYDIGLPSEMVAQYHINNWVLWGIIYVDVVATTLAMNTTIFRS